MNNELDENYWIKKLSESRFFTSKKDIDLLCFLVQSTKEGKCLKETIIAIDFFGKDASFDPGSDSIVRSNIYNLRKKLESYYLDEGAKDKVRFIIPKGGYLVKTKVVEDQTLHDKKQSLTKQLKLLKLALLLSVFVIAIFTFSYYNNHLNTKKQLSNTIHPIWTYYEQSKSPLLIVLGDYFMIQKTEQTDSTNYSFIRNPAINSQVDFFYFIQKHPEQGKDLKKLGQNYFGEEIPKCFLQLLNMFKNNDKQIKLKYSSELTLTDIRENDLIFVGDYGTMNILNPFFEKTNFRYSNNPQIIYALNKKKDTTDYFFMHNPHQSVFQNDYAIATNVESYPGKKILFITSFLPFGKSEILYKLQEATFPLELTDDITNFASEWGLLMKISGIQSSGFDYEILNFYE